MRKGFSLVEMLTVIVILAAVSVAFTGLFKTVLRDIPMLQKTARANTSIQHMLRQMRRDVDTAENISLSSDGNKSLLLQKDDCTIHYQFADREISRTLSNNAEKKRTWPLPYAIIDWRLRQKNGTTYAVEIQAAFEYMIDARKQKRLANSYMFFVSAIAGPGEIK